jgi:1-acyl-sn-glycerol-3-phosphate acyltransferase
MNMFYQASRRFFKLFFVLFYRHKIYGADSLPSGAAIIAPNHISNWDPPMVGASFPGNLSFLAKRELFDIPVLSWCIKHLNAYPVTGLASDLTSIKMIIQLLGQGKKIVIFPEGERTVDGEIGEIKTGIGMLALRSKSPIIPVYISGNYEIWPINQRFPKLWGKTAIVFGNPIFINKFLEQPKKEAQEAIAHQVATSIAALRDWYKKGALGSIP